jgi:halimadienyl-diphosphate synthase
MDLQREILQLLRDIGPGRAISPSAYDTAWVARLIDIVPEMGEPAMDWLCAHQLPDGSWGAAKPFYHHDRIICTLSALVALAKYGHRATDQKHIELGREALGRMVLGATRGLQADPNGATIAFELLAPALLAEAEKLGLISSQKERVLGRIAQLRQKKLALLRNQVVNRNLTIAFSLEMLEGDPQPVFKCNWENLQEANGSIAYSPASTAYFALRVKSGDARACRYLSDFARDGAVPYVAPIDVFEISWSLWSLALTGALAGAAMSETQRSLDFLQHGWRKKAGIAAVAGIGFIDGDAAALSYEILTRLGREVDIEAVLGFEEEQHFRCYAMEANPSIGTNVHCLGALRAYGYDRQAPPVQKIVRFLLNTAVAPGCWIDKWHLSPYYTSALTLITGIDYVELHSMETVNWMLETQRPEGAWGALIPTAEETAYCLQALIIARRHDLAVPADVLRRGADWLACHIDPPYPPLWIGKCLYTPELVVRSAILSALCLAQEDGLWRDNPSGV